MKKHSPATGVARRTLTSFILIVLLTLAAYANTLNVPFIFDDTNNITANPYIRMISISADSIAAVFNSPSVNRPLANLTVALNYYFGRYDVRGYHVVNLLIHIVTALLMFLVTRLTLRLSGTESSLTAFLAAALWLVNPVHTQSVTYTIQRMNSLAAMFYMLALFCYIRARIKAINGQGPVPRQLLYALCLLAGLSGLCSKEIAATLPLFVFIYEWYFFQNLNGVWLKKQRHWIGLALLAIIIVAAVYLGTRPINEIIEAYEKHPFTLFQRLLTEPGVVVYYICLLLFPHPNRLSLVYDFPVYLSILTPLTTLTAMLGILALILAGVLSAKRQRLLSFAIFWFLGNLIIESSIFGLALVYEHRTYLPSIFPFIALTALLIKPSRTRIVFVVFLGVFILVCALWTHQRNTVWNDPVRFWRDNLDKMPNEIIVRNNLGIALSRSGKYEEAISHYKTVLNVAAYQDSAMIHNNLGIALEKAEKYEEAISHYQVALRLDPDYINAHFNLGNVFYKTGRYREAISHYQAGLCLAPGKEDPDHVSALNNLGAALMKQGDTDKAILIFRKTLNIIPDNLDACYNLGVALEAGQDYREALNVFTRILSISPDHEQARHEYEYCREMINLGSDNGSDSP